MIALEEHTIESVREDGCSISLRNASTQGIIYNPGKPLKGQNSGQRK
jgi:hypothetical protein